jgi:hypothetical protein
MVAVGDGHRSGRRLGLVLLPLRLCRQCCVIRVVHGADDVLHLLDEIIVLRLDAGHLGVEELVCVVTFPCVLHGLRVGHPVVGLRSQCADCAGEFFDHFMGFAMVELGTVRHLTSHLPLARSTSHPSRV